MTRAMGLLAHIWLPVLTTLSMARALCQVFPTAVVFPAGAWTLGLGVLSVYTADRLLEPGRLPVALSAPLWALCGLSCLSMVALAYLEPARLLPVDIALGSASLAYGRLKRSPVLKTLLVTATWWIGCTLLPFDLRGRARLEPLLLLHPAALGLSLSVAAGALLCDFKDAARDARAGVRSLPVLLGARRAQWVCAGLALSAVVACALAHAWALLCCAAAMLVLTPNLAWLERPLLGPLSVDGALALPGLWLWWFG